MGLTDGEPVEVGVESLVANLPELLGAMVGDPRPIVAVVGLGDGRYVQFLAHPEGLWAEVAANAHLRDDGRLTPCEEGRLRADGWREPEGARRPNWHLGVPDDADLAGATAIIARAVLMLADGRTVSASVRTFPGQGPAAPPDPGAEAA